MFNLAIIPQFILHYKIINTISSLRSSRSEVFCKKGVLRNFTNFTEKHLCQGLFFNKVAGLQLFSKNTSSDCFWVFLESSQNTQENTSARVYFLIKSVLAQMFSCKFCEICKYIHQFS